MHLLGFVAAFSENWWPVMTCAAPEHLQLIAFSN